MSSESFYAAALSAGAILTGFCGTFLSFRLQREATYHRQVTVDFTTRAARDILIGLTHFTGPLLLLLLATLSAALFGFVFPLLALTPSASALFRQPRLIAAGEVAALVLLAGYFLGELVHYDILKGQLAADTREWRRQRPIVIFTVVLSVLAAVGVWLYTAAG